MKFRFVDLQHCEIVSFLSQAVVEALLEMEKHRMDDTVYPFPGAGGELRIPLISGDRREEFILDIRRHRIEVVRGGKFQTRARVATPIARLCFARPHRNPDGEEIPGAHLHVYRDGFELRWAYPLDAAVFSDPDNRQQLLVDFMTYAKITRPPEIEPDIFA